MEDDNQPRRLRGAQPGNCNALKHGFYSRHFKHGEVEDLAVFNDILDEEIDMLRVVHRRALEYATQFEPGDLKEWSRLLTAFGLSATHLGKLLDYKHRLQGGQNELDALFTQAIRELLKGYGYE
jgi:hypothetical protein